MSLPVEKDVWLAIDTIEIKKTENCLFCATPLTKKSDEYIIKCVSCSKKIKTDKLVQTVSIDISANYKQYNIPTDLLAQTKPDWDDIPINELEDELLLTMKVQVEKNRVVGLKEED